MSQQLKFKKLNPNAVIPLYATQGSNGLDLTATAVEIVEDHKGLNNTIICRTGLAVQIPKGFVGLLFPRSSVSRKPLSLANSVGVIDTDYTGEIMLKFRYTGNSAIQWTRHIYEVGERVGQLVIVSAPKFDPVEASTLEETTRSTGGFGSTGK